MRQQRLCNDCNIKIIIDSMISAHTQNIIGRIPRRWCSRCRLIIKLTTSFWTGMLVAILSSLILEGRWMFCRSGVDTKIDAVLPESSPGEGCCPDDDDERIARLGLRVKRKKKLHACLLVRVFLLMRRRRRRRSCIYYCTYLITVVV